MAGGVGEEEASFTQWQGCLVGGRTRVQEMKLLLRVLASLLPCPTLPSLDSPPASACPKAGRWGCWSLAELWTSVFPYVAQPWQPLPITDLFDEL